MPDIFTQPPKKPTEQTPVENTPVVQPAQQQQQSNESSQPQQSPVEQSSVEVKNADHPASAVLTQKRNTVQILSHYCERPDGLHFINQEDNEEILLFLRRHIATNIPWAVTAVLLLFLPFIVVGLFTITNFSLFTIPFPLTVVLIGFYYLVVFNYALLNFINWFYDMGIVSKKRLIDLDANNILHHHWAETEIADVVDVSVTQQGFFQSFFNYGNVHIQTEAIKANFEFVAAPKPSTVSDIIGDLKELVSERKHKNG